MISSRRSTERARQGPGPLRLRATRSFFRVVGTILVVALAGACGSSSSRPDAQSATAADGRDGAADGSRAGDGAAAESGDEGGAAGSDGDGDGSDLTAAEICRLIPDSDVARALGVASAKGSPSTSDTPQCSFVFEIEGGGRSDATVAVLRTHQDLEGREGREAFDYVVNLNREASGSDPTVTDLSIGNRAVLLSGEGIHLGVIQFGPRIVTTIVSARVADADAAIGLSRLTPALAP